MDDQQDVKNQLIDELIDIKEKEQILNFTIDLICIAGTDGYFKYINPAWEKALGYQTEELHSKSFLLTIHTKDHKKNELVKEEETILYG